MSPSPIQNPIPNGYIVIVMNVAFHIVAELRGILVYTSWSPLVPIHTIHPRDPAEN